MPSRSGGYAVQIDCKCHGPHSRGTGCHNETPGDEPQWVDPSKPPMACCCCHPHGDQDRQHSSPEVHRPGLHKAAQFLVCHKDSHDYIQERLDMHTWQAHIALARAAHCKHEALSAHSLPIGLPNGYTQAGRACRDTALAQTTDRLRCQVLALARWSLNKRCFTTPRHQGSLLRLSNQMDSLALQKPSRLSQACHISPMSIILT